MSSIFQVVSEDIRGYKPSKGNPVVQNDRSYRDNGNVNEDADRLRKEEAMLRKAAREAEGGRGGGYNDRQEIASDRAVEEKGGFDDFGRRVSKQAGGNDRQARAQAALLRLRQKMVPQEEPAPATASHDRGKLSSEGDRKAAPASREAPAARRRSRSARKGKSRSRSRSRSGRRDKSKSARRGKSASRSRSGSRSRSRSKTKSGRRSKSRSAKRRKSRKRRSKSKSRRRRRRHSSSKSSKSSSSS